MAGTAGDINQIGYMVKRTMINSASPGVFFHSSKVTAPAAAFTIDVIQEETHPNFNTLFAIQQNNIRFFNADSNSALGTINAHPSAHRRNGSGNKPRDRPACFVR